MVQRIAWAMINFSYGAKGMDNEPPEPSEAVVVLPVELPLEDITLAWRLSVRVP